MPGELSTTGLPGLSAPGAPAAEGLTVGVTGAVTAASVGTATAASVITRKPLTTVHRRLEAGDQFGPRYHVMKILGIGGMGAVYQAWDEELGMAVALKVIRPEYADRGGEESERRFKRELVLARQVTHKNVIRIHDLGEVDGVKYISMPFVDGADLATVIRKRGKLPVAEALHTGRQIAAGLSAAHEVGVVHRDLKPANILMGGDQALITDFGIAHSLSGPAEAGIVGTLRYMAPEQARGKPVDHRADIYAVGLILYEMLTGHRWTAHAAIEALTQTLDQQTGDIPPETKSAAALTFGEEVPEAIAAVLRRCLAFDRDDRYGSAAELALDLEYIDDDGNAMPRPVFYTLPARLPWIGGWQVARGTAIALLALLVAVPVTSVAAYYVTIINAPLPVDQTPVSVVIADFTNSTGDASLDGVVEQALGIALEGAPFITAMPRVDAQRLVTQINAGAAVNVANARIVAQREGINVVLAGMIAPAGRGYTVTLNSIDPVPGTTLASYTASASNRDQLLSAVAELASNLRTALGDTTPESTRALERETFTSSSLEAASVYSQAQALMASGKWNEAIPLYERATQIDPGFGRAYSAWAASLFYLGRTEESEALYKKAFAASDRMTPREKYRVMGNYYLTVTQAYDQAIENYKNLVDEYPADQAGHANLAIAYLYMLDLPKAFEHGRRALELYPASLKQRNNYALYAMYAGDLATAAKESQAVLDKDPAYFRAYVPRAISAMDRSLTDVASSYEAMAALGPQAASIAQMGLGDLALYQGRHADAIAILRPAIETDLGAKNTAGAAAKYMALAEAYDGLGRRTDALAAVRSGLDLSTRSSVLLAGARRLIAAGLVDEARPLEAELAKRLDPHSRVYGKIIQAELYMADSRTADAVDSLLASQKIADMWLTHFLLGQNYIKAQRFPEALAQFEECLRRRGEATAIFLDDIPSIRYLVPLAGWLGQARAGMGLK